jgi:hypothetical protein
MQLKMETDDMDEELMSPKGVKRTKYVGIYRVNFQVPY